MDDYIWASINATNGVHDPETGFYGTLVYAGCESRDRASQIEKALRRCAFYMFHHKQADIGMHASIKNKHDGTYDVEFVAVKKAYTYKYLIDRYGSDKSRWPYDPTKRNEK
jgi:hypothetical protein